MAQDPGRAGAEPIEIAPELRNTEQHAVDETRPSPIPRPGLHSFRPAGWRSGVPQ